MALSDYTVKLTTTAFNSQHGTKNWYTEISQLQIFECLFHNRRNNFTGIDISTFSMDSPLRKRIMGG